MMFPPHLTVNPYGPHTPAPKTDSGSDVPLAQFKAAQAVNATHLSRDGETAYDERKFGVWYCQWDEEDKCFGSWFKWCDELPEGAVKIECL